MPVKRSSREFQQMASTGCRGQRAYRRGRRIPGTRWERGVRALNRPAQLLLRETSLPLAHSKSTGRYAMIPPWAQLIRGGIHFDLELNCGDLIDISKFFETSIFERWGLCPLFLSLS